MTMEAAEIKQRLPFSWTNCTNVYFQDKGSGFGFLGKKNEQVRSTGAGSEAHRPNARMVVVRSLLVSKVKKCFSDFRERDYGKSRTISEICIKR